MEKILKNWIFFPPQLLCHLFFNKVCRLASLCICPCIEREKFFVPDIQSVSCKNALLKHRDVQCCLSQLNWPPIFMSLTRQRRYKTYKYAGKRLSSMLGIQLAAFIPVGHNADAVHGVVLVRGEGARDTVSVQVLVALQAGGRRLDSRAWTALAAQRLMRH